MSGPTPPTTPERPQHPLPGAKPSGRYRPNTSIQEKRHFPPTPETPNTAWRSPQVLRSPSEESLQILPSVTGEVIPSSPVTAGPFLTRNLSEDKHETDADELESSAPLTASIGARVLSGIFQIFNVAGQRSRSRREALSRSRVDRLVGLIRDIDKGVPQEGDPEVITKKILPGDYRVLLDRLDGCDNDIFGYFHEKLRYEYRPSLAGRTQFSIRMNSPFHEGMISDINTCVDRWLGRIVENSRGEYATRTIETAGKIKSKGGRVVSLGEKNLRADCSYWYVLSGHTRLGMVMEVAWSQPTKKLRKKATEFIQESEGGIRTVVGLDFSGTYEVWDKVKDQWDRTGIPQRGPSKVFVWRAVFDRRTGNAVFDDDGQPKITESVHIFSNESGEPDLNERVCLKLEDMIPERAIREDEINRRKDMDGVELVIDSPTFLQYFDQELGCQKEFDDESKPARQLREAEKNVIKEAASNRRRAKQEKELKNVPKIKNWIQKHTYRLRQTKARQEREII
ncbi:hypothetical protein F5B21DRAFT_452332, partial [Xylaria acuta]